MKKITALLLALLMLFPMLSACSGGQEEITTGEDVTSEEPETTVEETTGKPSGGEKLSTEAYTYNTVDIGGGGYVTGMVIHSDGTAFARTDVGGLYRRDKGTERWVSLTDKLSGGEPAVSIDGVAVAPSDSKIIYMAAGRKLDTAGYLWKTTDGGETWVNTKLNAMFCGNNGYSSSDGFGKDSISGECIAIHPTDPNVVYVGTRKDGVYRTLNGGESWEKIKAIPAGRQYIGNRCVVFDKEDPNKIYVSVHDTGIYMSADGGETWSLMAGSPKQAKHIHALSGGKLIVVAGKTSFSLETFTDANDGIFLFDGASWKSITPAAKQTNGSPEAFGDCAVDPSDENHLVTVSLVGKQLFVSTNGGKSWKATSATTLARDSGDSSVWIGKWYHQLRYTCICFDPTDVKKVYACHGAGIWRTDDITSTNVKWRASHEGLEELVVNNLFASPLDDVAVVVGVMDVGGVTSLDVNTAPGCLFMHTGSGFNIVEVTSITYCRNSPEFVVCVGKKDGKKEGIMGYSKDGGKTWTATGTLLQYTDRGFGYLAMSSDVGANGNPTIIFIQKGQVPKISTNLGRSWKDVSGLPSTLIPITDARCGNIIEADKNDPSVFYVLDPTTGNFYKSTDGGFNFEKIKKFGCTLLSYGTDTACIKTWAGCPGLIAISMNNYGLFISTDGGQTFKQSIDVRRARLMCMGKGIDGSELPSIYVEGNVLGKYGYYRTDDLGETWAYISQDFPVSYGSMTIDADPNEHGLLYIGTNGHGVFYGRPATK